MRILVASRNKKKQRELERVLSAAGISGIEILTLADVDEYPETPETGFDYVDNARIKTADGVHYTGLATIADDSGIAVDELRGMPGVLSARWSGAHGADADNNRLLLAQLADTPDERRSAHYVSVCVLQLPAGLAERAGMDQEYVGEGRWQGRILREERGEGGFGYDPLFSCDEEPEVSVAELPAVRKDELSHRGKALAQLVPVLRQLSTLEEV